MNSNEDLGALKREHNGLCREIEASLEKITDTAYRVAALRKRIEDLEGADYDGSACCFAGLSIPEAMMTSAPFAATKADRALAACDEDCAKVLSGARFDIPFPPKQPDSATLRQMRDALQSAWIIFDGLRAYRSQGELLAILRTKRFEETREAVRKAAALRIGRDA